MGYLAGHVGIADPRIVADEFADQVYGAGLGRLAIADEPGAVVPAIAPHQTLLLVAAPDAARGEARRSTTVTLLEQMF